MGKKKRLQREKQQHAILTKAEAASSSVPFVGRLSHAEMIALKNWIKQSNERTQMFARIRARYLRRTVMKILMLQKLFEMWDLSRIFKYKRVFLMKKAVKWRPFLKYGASRKSEAPTSKTKV